MLRNLLYRVYEHQLLTELKGKKLPQHVGVILDGNRRWATGKGSNSKTGHAAGAKKILEFLQWCDELDIPVRTLWLLSTENLQRDEAELKNLLDVIEQSVTELANQQRWRINLVGAKDAIPQPLATTVATAVTATQTLLDKPIVNVAIAYGGRREVVDAVKSWLEIESAKGHSINELVSSLSDTQISAHLYTKGQPDPDLVIRTSGEQRLSGFLLWQSAHSEFYFCEAYWPAFRRIDFLRALRAFTQRQRRYGL
ncbi:MAG: isoprenyl transferase [Candidatus Nanopelagicales bacterium]